jgi:hypothetical protein
MRKSKRKKDSKYIIFANHDGLMAIRQLKLYCWNSLMKEVAVGWGYVPDGAEGDIKIISIGNLIINLRLRRRKEKRL